MCVSDVNTRGHSVYVKHEIIFPQLRNHKMLSAPKDFSPADWRLNHASLCCIFLTTLLCKILLVAQCFKCTGNISDVFRSGL